MQNCLLPRPDSLPFLLYIFPLLICQTLFFFFYLFQVRILEHDVLCQAGKGL
ncbi:hypothetical protein NC653_028544 [Populus alba x Populus x berolinensis]|uniref:Uncharacterized protein n=1 Tax=Populus alba x Populus x berolinensis TaxID=444605 RepID=A0AAD6M015_9ROSI|nr:hypothetical protein NC653_028544 [Populus alba x Populus x berolinensis]